MAKKIERNYGIDLLRIYDLFYQNYKNVRLIPQTHKFLNLA